MTRDEFFGWVEEHYDELKVAARKKYGAQDCEDILHNALLSLLESQMLKVMPLSLAWPWAVSQMRGRASHWFESKRRATSDASGETSGGNQSLEALHRPAISGSDYKQYPRAELNGSPLGPHWNRWIGKCPRCDGETTMVQIVDQKPNGTTGRDGVF